MTFASCAAILKPVRRWANKRTESESAVGKEAGGCFFAIVGSSISQGR